jgi:hypothetical protein
MSESKTLDLLYEVWKKRWNSKTIDQLLYLLHKENYNDFTEKYKYEIAIKYLNNKNDVSYDQSKLFGLFDIIFWQVKKTMFNYDNDTLIKCIIYIITQNNIDTTGYLHRLSSHIIDIKCDYTPEKLNEILNVVRVIFNYANKGIPDLSRDELEYFANNNGKIMVSTIIEYDGKDTNNLKKHVYTKILTRLISSLVERYIDKASELSDSDFQKCIMFLKNFILTQNIFNDIKFDNDKITSLCYDFESLERITLKRVKSFYFLAVNGFISRYVNVNEPVHKLYFTMLNEYYSKKLSLLNINCIANVLISFDKCGEKFIYDNYLNYEFILKFVLTKSFISTKDKFNYKNTLGGLFIKHLMKMYLDNNQYPRFTNVKTDVYDLLCEEINTKVDPPAKLEEPQPKTKAKHTLFREIIKKICKKK